MGFVSNSSSASYHVYIKNTKVEEVIDILSQADYGGGYFEIEETLDRLKKSIEESERNMIKTLKQINESKRDYWGPYSYEYDLDKMDTYKHISTIQDETERKRRTLAEKGVKISQEGPNVCISSDTSMHNSFNEGVAEAMKEAVLGCIIGLKKEAVGFGEDNSDYTQRQDVYAFLGRPDRAAFVGEEEDEDT